MVTFQTLLLQLRALSRSEIKALADRAQVPFHTVAKIRSGETANPGILTVEPLFRAVQSDVAASAAPMLER